MGGSASDKMFKTAEECLGRRNRRGGKLIRKATKKVAGESQ